MTPPTFRADGTWLGFELAGERYAVPLASVREVVRAEPPTPVPGAPSDVLGIISLRGSIVTVLDGCRRLGLSAPREARDERFVIFHEAEETVGVRIDALDEVLEFEDPELLPVPPGRAARSDDPVLGALSYGGGFIALLDVRRFCRLTGTPET